MIRSSSERSDVTPDAVPWMPGVIEDQTGLGTGPSGDTEDEQTEFERGHDAGYARGHGDGLAEGQRLEREKLAALTATLDAVLADVSERQNDWLATLEENLAALAVGIARQLLAREVESDRDSVVDLVRRGLSHFPVGQSVAIRLNPVDLTLLSDVSGESATSRDDIRWIADPRVEPGGCVVEGPDRVIDGRVERALERVYRALTDV
ncbi:MAG: hypothetical protein MJB57_04920 [Gemmatimonadetes bacterium]|nr:hypothetical protein [Gemmatimonadota bacterium]